MRHLPLLALLACLPFGGCIAGVVYQNTIEPLDLNLTNTPVGTNEGAVNRKDLNLQYIRIAWDGDDIAGAARSAGLREIYYADHEVLSVLGIWRQDYVHVYGR